MPILVLLVLAMVCAPQSASAQTGSLSGVVRDETGGALAGVTVTMRREGAAVSTASDEQGRYRFDAVAPGRYAVTWSLVNFGSTRRELALGSAGAQADVVLHLVLSADVTVTGRNTFTNLADARQPDESLVGVAQSASQGAVTARQLAARPVMRAGEVLETVPGIVISQHSGEGKANQYYLRGFNLDHGTDFATTLAGMPVNMPTHGHGQGYSDLNFLIPELVTGVQFSKGPYFADQGDFATAGSASINYANYLNASVVRVTAGGQGFSRALAAASPAVGGGRLLAAAEVMRNDGPWTRADAYRRVNGVLRYSRGDAVNGFAITGMGYDARWNATDQVPARAIAKGLISRFGNLDSSNGGNTSRYSASFEWQRTRVNGSTKVTAYGIGYDLDLFSNFTFFLDDPINGDQFHQADRRFVSGAKASYRRIGRWAGREMQNTVGVQLRNDDIAKVGLYHTYRRERLETIREDSVLETSLGGYVQNETTWTPWLRSLTGLRIDGYRFGVDSLDLANSGAVRSGVVSPKGSVVLGPWRGTELYGNAGLGFHSNDARGTTIARDPVTGDSADPVTPLVRATGAEAGVRSVLIPHLQTTLTVWSLSLASELVFVGDAGNTEAGRPSHRYGIEFANYYSPRPWLILDGDLSWSTAHFTDRDSVGTLIPGSVQTVVSAGVTLDSLRRLSGSIRLRYFGPRPLVEDNSARSNATGLLNMGAGYQLTGRTRVTVDLFNLFDARNSDIDYFYTSRLPGEPAGGVDDMHSHPTLPRTARLGVAIAF